MNNLSQECIEQIEKNCHYPDRLMFKSGAIEAITNQSIFRSAKLMTEDEALSFIQWVFNERGEHITIATELLTIFRNQNKEK